MHFRSQHRDRARRGARGLTLVELSVAIAVLTVCVYMLSQTVLATIAQAPAKRERAEAMEAVRSVIERMRNEDFADVFALYNADPSDDPGGPATAPGNLFAVPGFDLQPGDPDGFVGEIVLPADGPVLREDADVPELGLPRDLSGDGAVDEFDHALDHIVLPVLVRMEWQSRLGPRRIEVHTMFSDLEEAVP